MPGHKSKDQARGIKQSINQRQQTEKAPDNNPSTKRQKSDGKPDHLNQIDCPEVIYPAINNGSEPRYNALSKSGDRPCSELYFKQVFPKRPKHSFVKARDSY